MKYKFYAGGGETSRGKTEISDVKNNTKDLIDLIIKKKVGQPGDIVFTGIPNGENNYSSSSQVFPAFLIWAVGK